jgi:hypothetical protein
MFVSPSDGAFITAPAAADLFPPEAAMRFFFQGRTVVEKKTRLNFVWECSFLIASARTCLATCIRVPVVGILPRRVAAPSGIVMFLSMDPLVSKTNPMLREKIRRP